MASLEMMPDFCLQSPSNLNAVHEGSRRRSSNNKDDSTATSSRYHDDDISAISLCDAVYLFTLSSAGVWLGYIAAMWTWPENLAPGLALILTVYILSTHQSSEHHHDESSSLVQPSFLPLYINLTEKAVLPPTPLSPLINCSPFHRNYWTGSPDPPSTSPVVEKEQLKSILSQDRDGSVAGVFAFGKKGMPQVWVIVEDMDSE